MSALKTEHNYRENSYLSLRIGADVVTRLIDAPKVVLVDLLFFTMNLATYLYHGYKILTYSNYNPSFTRRHRRTSVFTSHARNSGVRLIPFFVTQLLFILLSRPVGPMKI
jgi:hypothetical protein